MKSLAIGTTAVLLGGFLACFALTSPQVGVPISDAQAATITGGCSGASTASRGAGTACGSHTIYSAGSQDTTLNYNTNIDVNCGGSTDPGGGCSSCYFAQTCILG